ncbi:hypothetical protein ACFTY8_41125 [Streptomyces mirabilis]|uniref:hypothetical protein n=1 Tax=Streptomyces mirabilis TaxID=68239 RepID=UPI0036304D95
MPNTTADQPQFPLARRAAVSFAGVVALTGLAGAYTPSFAYAEPPAPADRAAAAQPAADFSDCPALPAGVDPARWIQPEYGGRSDFYTGQVQLFLARDPGPSGPGGIASSTMAPRSGAVSLGA